MITHWSHFMWLLLLSITCNAQNTTQTQLTIDKYGQGFIKNKHVNSVSIGILKEGITYTGHYGEITKGKGDTPNNETLYEVGSVTKTLTGFLLAKAVLEKRIDLDDNIQKYLKSSYSNLVYNDQPITIRHLITHTSGLPLFLPKEMNGLYETLAEDVPEKYLALEKQYSKDQFFKDLGDITLTQEPGINYSYSNAGTEILGHVLETIYDKSVDVLFQETFSNYGMNNTNISRNTVEGENPVKGYWLSNTKHSPNNLNTLWATGSGANMTMNDMLQYAKLQLDRSNEIVQESHRILSSNNSSRKTAYLWDVKQDKYGTYFNHHGGTSGVQNWLFIFPKYDLAISIITNHSSTKTPKLLSKTAQKILKEVISE